MSSNTFGAPSWTRIPPAELVPPTMNVQLRAIGGEDELPNQRVVMSSLDIGSAARMYAVHSGTMFQPSLVPTRRSNSHLTSPVLPPVREAEDEASAYSSSEDASAPSSVQARFESYMLTRAFRG